MFNIWLWALDVKWDVIVKVDPTVWASKHYPEVRILVVVFFLSVCLLADVPDGSPPGFPTEAIGCSLFGFYRYSSQLFGFVLYFIVFSDHFFLSLSRFASFFYALPLSLSGSTPLCKPRIQYGMKWSFIHPSIFYTRLMYLVFGKKELNWLK